MNIYKLLLIIFGIVLLFIISAFIATQDAYGQDVEGKVKTVYDLNGRPVNQSQDAKGLHRVSGSIKLTSGVATVLLNTNINDGRQDISFISANTYRGNVWVADTSNANTYKIYPQSGTKFLILSSDATDTNTVNYWVEGE
jgi:hypothetical protein